MRKHLREQPGVALVNLQRRYALRSAALTAFAQRLHQRLRLGRNGFNICFVDDGVIRRLNRAFRGKDKPTDVLSFPWRERDEPQAHGVPPPSHRTQGRGIPNFLGDVVISVPTARRNARQEGHSALNELRWLVLHGVLHLRGYDHEHDHGEMNALELALREELGVVGARGKRKARQVKRQNAKDTGQRVKPHPSRGVRTW